MTEAKRPEPSWLQEDLIAAVRSGLDRRGWTQAQLARESSMTESHVARLLAGEREGSLSAWAELLDIALNLGIGGYPIATVEVHRHAPARPPS